MDVVADAKIIRGGKFPTVIFYHSYCTNFHLYSTICREMASKGCVVFSIDCRDVIKPSDSYEAWED